jgi:alkylation response protein AidB-like acyl-CoA dehydrogenase
MDFELSDEQKDIQRAALEFARGEFDPDVALDLDQNGKFPETIWKKAAQLGFIGVHYPKPFGGQDLSLFENVLIIEAFCRVDSGIGGALSLADLGSEVISKFGSQTQKEKFLVPLAKGEKRLSVAFGESEDGKDLSSISTVGERKEKGYLLQGRKRFVPNASLADAFIVLCKEPKEGWIALLVERETEGIKVHPIEKMALRMIPFGDLIFEEIWVPHENRLGREREGIDQFNYFHQVMGMKSLAQALGVIQGAFDRALIYSTQREQFGKRLSQFQVIRHKLADMAIGMEVARWLTYKSAIEFEDHGKDQEFLSVARLEVRRRLVWTVDEALQIFGGYGYMAEQEIEHFYRDAWAIGVELGTEEELKDILSEKILGKQR